MRDLIRGTLSALIIHVEAPAKGFAVVVDADGMVGTHGCCLRSSNGRCWYWRWSDQDPSLVGRILDQVCVWERSDVQPRLMPVQATPDQKPTTGCGGNRVMCTACDGRDRVVLEGQGGNGGGNENHGVIATGAFSNAGLAKAVETPGPDGIIPLDRKRVVKAASDEATFLLEAEQCRRQGLVSFPLNDTMPQLVLLPRTPDKHVAILSQSKSMVGSAGNLFDAPEVRQFGRRGLDLRPRREAQNTIVPLNLDRQ